MKPNFVKVVFVIDESGSMYMSSKETINGINEFLQDQNKNSEGECEVSFYKFNSKINKVFEHISLKDVAYLTEEDYIPGGMTKGAYNMLSNVTSNYRSSFLDGEPDMFLSKSLDNTNAEYLNEQKSKSV